MIPAATTRAKSTDEPTTAAISCPFVISCDELEIVVVAEAILAVVVTGTVVVGTAMVEGRLDTEEVV